MNNLYPMCRYNAVRLAVVTLFLLGARAACPVEALEKAESDVPHTPILMVHAYYEGGAAKVYKDEQIPDKLKKAPYIEHIIPEFSDAFREKPSALGGKRDRQAFLNALPRDNHKPIIFKGVCRGGVVVALVNGSQPVNHHAGTIIESPPAQWVDVVSHKIGFLRVIPGLSRLLHRYMHWHPRYRYYNPKDIQPIEVIHKGDKPLLCVASIEVEVIPVASTLKLYVRARQAGRQVYLKLLPQGKHLELADAYIPEQFAFIAHCTGTATAEQKELLQKLQPTVDDLKKQGLI